MIIPRYWAEARLKQRDGKRQASLRRFGWSDSSQAEAQAHADARLQEAFARWQAGEPLLRRERQQAYGGEGVPIREEILRQEGDCVITRNAYGAHCLNSPGLLFADIDFPELRHPTGCLDLLGWLLPVAAAGCWFFGAEFGRNVALALLLVFVVWRLFAWRRRKQREASHKPEEAALARIDAFIASHPDWSLRLYRSPAGLRVMATQRAFDPLEPAVSEFFAALDVDPLYASLCREQRCFRARLTAKPWRIAMQDRLSPRSARWPVAPELTEARQAWIADYEQRAKAFAACRFLKRIGKDRTDPALSAAIKLHDRLSGALEKRPLA